MATKKKAVRASSSPREESNDRNRDSRDSSERDSRDSRDSGHSSRGRDRDEKSVFVNITKLFETKKNPDNLVGTCKPEHLYKLEDLVAEAGDKKKGISFFVFLQGKWGPSLAATLSREQEERDSFNDGNRGPSRDRGRSRY